MTYTASQFPSTPTSPVQRVEIVAPSNTATIQPPKGVLLVSGGDIAFRLSSDPATTRVLTGLPAMYELAFEVVQVMATGTTPAAIIWALY